MGTQSFDAYGVPIFYANVVVPEPAGGGNVRVWNCVRKNGILVPVCEIIIPATDLVVAARTAIETATEMFKVKRGDGAAKDH